MGLFWSSPVSPVPVTNSASVPLTPPASTYIGSVPVKHRPTTWSQQFESDIEIKAN